MYWYYRIALIVIVFLMNSACGLHFISDVNSIALTDSSTGRRFIIQPGNKDVTVEDLEFNEYAAYVNRVLISTGFNTAMNERDADIVVFLSYGIGNPQSHIYSDGAEVASYTFLDRFLQLDAYDMGAFRKENKRRQVWKTTVISTGPSKDLRRVMPYMVAAMKPYVAKNTGRAIRVKLREADPTVKSLVSDSATIQ